MQDSSGGELHSPGTTKRRDLRCGQADIVEENRIRMLPECWRRTVHRPGRLGQLDWHAQHANRTERCVVDRQDHFTFGQLWVAQDFADVPHGAAGHSSRLEIAQPLIAPSPSDLVGEQWAKHGVMLDS